MFKYYDRTYYSLSDIADDLSYTGKGPFRMASTTYHRSVELPVFINNVLTKVGYDTLTMTDLINNQYLTEVWTKYIYPTFYNQYVCSYDKVYCYLETDDPDQSAATVFADYVGPIISWMQSSTQKFSLIIANQEANKDNLLSQIKASSTTKFNDTPQDGGDFSDDNHTSTVTSVESGVDGGTLMSRLNEVENNLKRLYKDWANEFRQFIIWSVND